MPRACMGRCWLRKIATGPRKLGRARIRLLAALNWSDSTTIYSLLYRAVCFAGLQHSKSFVRSNGRSRQPGLHAILSWQQLERHACYGRICGVCGAIF